MDPHRVFGRRSLAHLFCVVTLGAACGPSAPPRPPPSARFDSSPSMAAKKATDVTSAKPCKPAATAAELAAKARAAATTVSPATVILTPPLPDRWPAAAGGVLFFVYQVTPLPTGRVVYRIRGPLARIEFAKLDASPTVVRLDPPATLGDEELADAPRAGFDQRLAAAAEALVEVMAGCRAADSARMDLEPYREWLALNGLIERDLRRSAGAFLDWLEARR